MLHFAQDWLLPAQSHAPAPTTSRAAASCCHTSPGFSGLVWKAAPAHHGHGHWGSPVFGRSQRCLMDCSPMVLFIWSVIHLKASLWDIRLRWFYSVPFLSHLATTINHHLFVCLFSLENAAIIFNNYNSCQECLFGPLSMSPFCVKLVLFVTDPGLVLCCFE